MATISAPRAAWSAFRHRGFAVIWTATLVSNIGTWMYGAAAGWLMTRLDPHPLSVSLVQVATALPMFMFALPAGVLADIVDRRRLLIVVEVAIAAVSAAFAALVSLGVVTPAILLAFMFVIATGAAVTAPAWQSIVALLVPKEDLGAAVASNSVGVNISRAIGPALGGIVTVGVGLAAPFWIDAFSNLGVIAALVRWHAPETKAHRLPAERFASAFRTGVRYARNNRPLRFTLLRAAGFFLFASAYWALLPLVTRTQLGGSATLYGILLGSIGVGAVAGAFVLPRLKAMLGADRLVAAGAIGTAAALVLYGLARAPSIAITASLLAGASWIATLATLNVSAQLALPEWVRGRGLATYVTVMFGAMTVGSALWGEISAVLGLPAAHFLAAAGSLLATVLTSRYRLQSGTGLDLTPSMHWPAPIVAEDMEQHAGPVMVTVEYHVAPGNRTAFLDAINSLAAERRRDGAYAWGVFEDLAAPGRYVETFYVETWIEHLRQHERVTQADRALEERVERLLLEPSMTTHLVAADRR